MNGIITVLLALVIIAILAALFLWLKTPYYRIDRARMVRVLEMVLTGQARENDWNLTFGISIRHDPELEAIRQRCCHIEQDYFIGEGKSAYLFTAAGLSELQTVLTELQSKEKDDHDS